MADRNRLLAAGVVSAGAAVELVGGLEFTHLTKNGSDLILGRLHKLMVNDRKILFQGESVGLCYVEIACSRVLCNRHVIVYG